MLDKIKKYIDRFMPDYFWDIYKLKGLQIDREYYICRGFKDKKTYTMFEVLISNDRGQIKKIKPINYSILTSGKIITINIVFEDEVLEGYKLDYIDTYKSEE